ncbi:hypothetical protein N7475_006211 [Penicillium sp. IBT 31633x]|nr:hypothetical protein N7475_006211 [Penicillium sp. IBT 31633x]
MVLEGEGRDRFLDVKFEELAEPIVRYLLGMFPGHIVSAHQTLHDYVASWMQSSESNSVKQNIALAESCLGSTRSDWVAGNDTSDQCTNYRGTSMSESDKATRDQTAHRQKSPSDDAVILSRMRQTHEETAKGPLANVIVRSEFSDRLELLYISILNT